MRRDHAQKDATAGPTEAQNLPKFRSKIAGVRRASKFVISVTL
jgi:hypothetical protein